MAANTAVAGFGTTLANQSGIVAMVRSIRLGFALESADVTHMESPDGFKEKLPTLKEAQDVTFDLDFTAGLGKLLLDKTIENWTLTFPDTTAYVLNAFVSNIDISASVGDPLGASVTLTVAKSPVSIA
mgnify:CR=1 FL=1